MVSRAVTGPSHGRGHGRDRRDAVAVICTGASSCPLLLLLVPAGAGHVHSQSPTKDCAGARKSTAFSLLCSIFAFAGGGCAKQRAGPGTHVDAGTSGDESQGGPRWAPQCGQVVLLQCLVFNAGSRETLSVPRALRAVLASLRPSPPCALCRWRRKTTRFVPSTPLSAGGPLALRHGMPRVCGRPVAIRPQSGRERPYSCALVHLSVRAYTKVYVTRRAMDVADGGGWRAGYK